jgi:large subunit ribosomal protein L6
MSKIGKKPITFSSATVEVRGKKILISGPKAKFEHVLPEEIEIALNDKIVSLTIKKDTRINRMNWGMHRALLANKIIGAEVGFERKLKIVGLGYKAQLSGKKVTLSLGYSHKIDFILPDGVEMKADKTGQQLLFKSSDKVLLGEVCATIRGFRPPEPYKGTGIMYDDEIIIKKAGKAKASQ